jgi:hypothetical protein
MAVTSRLQLKKAFEKGAIPTQQDFSNLIDSMIHKQEDGLISEDEGLRISPKGPNKRLLTFFSNLTDFKPTWSIEQYPKNSPEFGLNLVNQEGESKLFIRHDGNIGIGTNEPTTKLDVNGNVNMQGRRGTYTSGQVPGDGGWYNITPKLSQCHAFELIAKISKPGRGLHAMLHAFALSTFKGSKSQITKSHAYYNSFRDKLDLRWVGNNFNYYLQIKTKRNYGAGNMINYYLTNLWWEDEEALTNTGTNS